MAIIIRTLGVVGIVIFGIFLSLTYSTPAFVEDIGKDFIKSKIQEKTDEKIDSLKPDKNGNALSKIANKLYEKNQKKIDNLKQQIKDNAHEKLADVIAEMRDLDCECRNKWAAHIKKGYEIKLASLQVVNAKIQNFMKIKYMEVATELKRDIRIFAGSNLVIFFLLVIVSFLKPAAMAHLFLPGMLLMASTLICSFFYIFEQNWLMTIIYNDYLGYSYLGYVGVLFLFLCDIVFNSARVTSMIINAILQAIGSVAEVSPC